MMSGPMRHRFTLEAPAYTPDGAGGSSQTFVRVCEIWGILHAVKRNGGPSERLDDERPGQRNLYLVAVRYLAVLTAGHRLKLGSRLFDIVSVFDPDGLKEQMHLYAEEQVP